jgi:hypothetical protein
MPACFIVFKQLETEVRGPPARFQDVRPVSWIFGWFLNPMPTLRLFGLRAAFFPDNCLNLTPDSAALRLPPGN